MDVLVLCAGEGKRLRPLTKNVPKPLLQITEADTILSRLLSQLTASEVVNDIYINISYLPDIFLRYIVDLDKHLRPKIILEESPLGSTLTLKRLLPRLSRPLLVIHGDLILENSQFSKMLIHFNSSDEESFMVGHQREHEGARSIIYHEAYKITYFREIASPIGTQNKIYSNSGMYFFAQKDLENLDIGLLSGPNLVNSFLPLLISNQSLYLYSWDGWRFSIDSIEILNKVRQMFSLQLI